MQELAQLRLGHPAGQASDKDHGHFDDMQTEEEEFRLLFVRFIVSSVLLMVRSGCWSSSEGAVQQQISSFEPSSGWSRWKQKSVWDVRALKLMSGVEAAAK